MKFRILVVDDDYGTLKLLDLILTNNGYDFCGFTSPHDAMKSFFSSHFDAVISDFYMPEMNGAEFLAEIRIKDKFIPFLILTSGHDINVAVDLMKKGADDYIAKIKFITHSIKGSAYNLTCMKLGDIAFDIQKACDQGNAELIKQLLSVILQTFKETYEEIQHYLST